MLPQFVLRYSQFLIAFHSAGSEFPVAPEKVRASRRAALILLLGSAVGLGAAAAYATWRLSDVSPQANGPPDAATAVRIAAYLHVLGISFLLFVLFMGGSYVLVRLIRRAEPRAAARRQKTPYVDAWSQYRVTPEDIARATGEEDAEGDRKDP